MEEEVELHSSLMEVGVVAGWPHPPQWGREEGEEQEVPSPSAEEEEALGNDIIMA